jgi:hypothetical protein
VFQGRWLPSPEVPFNLRTTVASTLFVPHLKTGTLVAVDVGNPRSGSWAASVVIRHLQRTALWTLGTLASHLALPLGGQEHVTGTVA